MKKNPKKEKQSPPLQNRLTIDRGQTVKWMGLICALFAFILYANTLGHDFTVDDGTVISNNKITKKGITAIPEIFTSSYRAGFWDRKEGLYRPLSVAMFAIEYEIAPENPALGHWINVILYALTAFLLMITLASVFKEYSLLFPLTATLLFIAHPIHTEVISNIKSRDEILCLLFSVLSLWQLHRYMNSRRTILMAASLFSFLLALLAKESAITWIGVVPLYLWFFQKDKGNSPVKISLLFVAAAGLYLLIRYSVLGELTGSAQLQLVNNSLLGTESVTERLATAFFILGKYLWLLVFPHPLAFDYSFNTIPVVSFAHTGTLISLLGIGLLVYVAIRGFLSRNPISFFILFFFGTIALVANILFLIESTMAERFLYLPSVGFTSAVAWIILHQFKLNHQAPPKEWSGYWKIKPLFTAVIMTVLLFFSIKTISRNNDWKDNLTLLAQDVKTNPESARIRYAYGSALLIEKALKEENGAAKESYLDQSIVQLEKGVAILPNYAEAWNHLGIAYKEKKNYTSAVSAFEKARSYKTFKEADFYISAGLAYGELKKYDEAIADFDRAIAIDPINAEAYNNKGLYLFESGRSDSSIFYFDRAIALKKDFHQAYYNKGNTLAKAGRFTDAIEQYAAALNIKPEYVDAWMNTGNCYAAMGDFNNAIGYYEKVLKVEPANRNALINLGITYKNLGDESKANDYFSRVKQP